MARVADVVLGMGPRPTAGAPPGAEGGATPADSGLAAESSAAAEEDGGSPATPSEARSPGSRCTDIGRHRICIARSEDDVSDGEPVNDDLNQDRWSKCPMSGSLLAPAAPEPVGVVAAAAVTDAGSATADGAAALPAAAAAAGLGDAIGSPQAGEEMGHAAVQQEPSKRYDAQLLCEFSPADRERESFAERGTDRERESRSSSRKNSFGGRSSFNRASFTQVGAPRPSFQHGRISFGTDRESYASAAGGPEPRVSMKRISFTQLRREQGDHFEGDAVVAGITGKTASSGSSVVRSLRNPQPLHPSEQEHVADVALADVDLAGATVPSSSSSAPMSATHSAPADMGASASAGGQGPDLVRRPIKRNTWRSLQVESAQTQEAMPRPVFEAPKDIWQDLPIVSGSESQANTPDAASSSQDGYPGGRDQAGRLEPRTIASGKAGDDAAFIMELSKVAEEDLDCELPKALSAAADGALEEPLGADRVVSALNGRSLSMRDPESTVSVFGDGEPCPALRAQRRAATATSGQMRMESSQIRELEARNRRLEADNQALRREMRALREEVEQLRAPRPSSPAVASAI